MTRFKVHDPLLKRLGESTKESSSQLPLSNSHSLFLKMSPTSKIVDNSNKVFLLYSKTGYIDKPKSNALLDLENGYR